MRNGILFRKKICTILQVPTRGSQAGPVAVGTVVSEGSALVPSRPDVGGGDLASVLFLLTDKTEDGPGFGLRLVLTKALLHPLSLARRPCSVLKCFRVFLRFLSTFSF